MYLFIALLLFMLGPDQVIVMPETIDNTSYAYIVTEFIKQYVVAETFISTLLISFFTSPNVISKFFYGEFQNKGYLRLRIALVVISSLLCVYLTHNIFGVFCTTMIAIIAYTYLGEKIINYILEKIK